jgi:hypothetical protein
MEDLMRAMYVFDLEGTLRNNPHLSEDQAVRLLQKLKSGGHKVVIWTASSQVPVKFGRLVDEIWAKGGLMPDWTKIEGHVVYSDDDPDLVESVERLVRALKVGPELSILDVKDLALLAA